MDILHASDVWIKVLDGHIACKLCVDKVLDGHIACKLCVDKGLGWT